MRVFEIPEGGKTSKGRAIQNMINIENDDKVLAYINVADLKDEEYIKDLNIVMCTKNGVVKKTSLDAYSRPRTNGIIAINVREGDELLEAKLTTGDSQIIMALHSGRAIRFEESKVRTMGRGASGVRGITLSGPEDRVVGMICVDDVNSSVMVVSDKGYGKRTAVDDYRITNRGGKGVKTLQVTEKTGNLISIKNVTDEDDLMIINKKGITIRMALKSVRVMGRATQGVRLINLGKGDSIAAVAKVPHDDEEDVELEEGEEAASEDTEEESGTDSANEEEDID
jgi:DNA gyrase subunit A